MASAPRSDSNGRHHDRMQGNLAGRVALVTGGSRGVGRGIALALAEDGADIAVNYRSDHDAAADVIGQIRELGRRAIGCSASVDDETAVRAMVADVIAEFGGVDIVVNNAGVASTGRPVIDTPTDEILRLHGVHVMGAYVATQAALPSLRSRGRGDIIFVSSNATASNSGRAAPYNMAKAAMESLALTLANEERKYGVRVNIVGPGIVDTDMGARLVKARLKADSIQDIASRSPFGRVCTPSDVGGLVRWLVSQEGSYVSGQRIFIDGGVR